MERVEIDRKAPVVESVETTIQAPVATVWSVISNLVDWPLWNPGVSGIEVEGDVVAGTVFTWMANGTRIRSRLECEGGLVLQNRNTLAENRDLALEIGGSWSDAPPPHDAIVRRYLSF